MPLLLIHTFTLRFAFYSQSAIPGRVAELLFVAHFISCLFLKLTFDLSKNF